MPGLPTPLPRLQSYYRSVGTPAHVYGSDTIIFPQKRIPYEGLVILSLEAVNVTQPQPHQKTDKTFLSQVVPSELQRFARQVTQILGGREDV